MKQESAHMDSSEARVKFTNDPLSLGNQNAWISDDDNDEQIFQKFYYTPIK